MTISMISTKVDPHFTQQGDNDMVALWYMLPEFFRNFLVYSISGSNLPYTIALGLIMLYWLFVIVGTFDLDLFDFDLDMDGDADIPPAMLDRFLDFFNVGEVPIMIVASATVISAWCSAMIVNFYIPESFNFFAHLVVAIPNIALGLFLGKIITTPIRKIYISMNNQDKTTPIVGNTATALMDIGPGEKGQADVIRNGSPLRIMVQLNENSKPVKKGDEVLMIQEIKRGLYEGEHFRL